MHRFRFKAQLLLLPILLSTAELVNTISGEVVFVKPTDRDSDCTEQNCTTLNEYASQKNGCAPPSTTFVFTEGNHTLETNFTILNSENISLIASPSARVVIHCGESSRFLFEGITGLVIENITFVSCGTPDLESGVLLREVHSGSLKNINVLKSNTTALYIQACLGIEITNLLIAHNKFHSENATAIVVVKNSSLQINGEFTIADNKVISNFPKTNCTHIFKLISIVIVINSLITGHASARLQVYGNVCPTGIVRFSNSHVSWNGAERFYNNTVCNNGALSLERTNFSGEGEISFFQNEASTAYSYDYKNSPTASLFIYDHSSLQVVGNISFYKNFGDTTSIECRASNITITGKLNISDNAHYAYSGIVIKTGSSLIVNGKSIVTNNLVYNSVIRIENSNLIMKDFNHFTNNWGASPITPRYDSIVTFSGNTTFLNNSGILFGIDSNITFDGNSTFIKNFVRDRYKEGGFILHGSFLSMKGKYLFEGNKVSGLDGGVIYGIDTWLTFEGQGCFSNNSARNGGVIYLQEDPRITIKANTELLFQENSAKFGAVFYIIGLVSDILCIDHSNSYTASSLCFIHSTEPYHVTFKNNNARKGGSLLYIDFINVDLDALKVSINKSSIDFLTRSKKEGNNIEPLIDAGPFRLCFCEDNVPVYNITSVSKEVSRGAKFNVSVAALMMFNDSFPRRVRSYCSEKASHGQIKENCSLNGGSPQNISNSCTDLEYQVYSTAATEEIVIAADEPWICAESSHLVHCLTVTVLLQDCQRGFSLAEDRPDRCSCDERLSLYTQQCDADNRTLSKKMMNFWIGVHLNESDSSYLGLILYPLCPFDYCLPPPLDIDLDNPDTQCSYQRSGLLCGQCQPNKSLTIGNAECSDCSNVFLWLIVPMAVLGVALVVFLFLTQLTVTSGVVNGLILYANILSENEVAFNLREVYGLRVFIAWVNLDFGIQTCFYNGMTHLTYAAWQFAFPLYLWLLVAFIIILCHYSIRASKLFGKTDPVAVLATIILLSYNKLLRNCLAILTPARLEYPPASEVQSIVWLYDGNVPFAQGGHAVLVIIALVSLVLLFLPFTLVLMFAQFLQRSDRISRCFNRFYLSHAIKRYQVPYKPASRYWIGLCLLFGSTVRITLISTIYTDNPNIHLLAISTFCIVLISIIGAAGGIYSNRWLNILEISYICNLGILSVLIYHFQALDIVAATICTYISTSVAFVTFIGVAGLVVYHSLVKCGYLKSVSVFKAMGVTRFTARVFNDYEKRETEAMSGVTTQDVFLLSENSERQMELRESLLDQEN